MNRTATSQLSAYQEELFYSHLSLVTALVHTLGSFSSRNFAAIEKEDLIQCGLIGLMEAAKHYDPDRNITFASYASRRIKGAIQDELRRVDFIPRSVRRSERKGRALLNKAEQLCGGYVDFVDTAALLGISVEELKEKLQYATVENTVFVSLDELNNEGTLEVVDEEPNQEEELEHSELKEQLVNEIQQLPEQQRIIILLYYYEELTFKEIGSILHITESRVAQIHKTVLETLRAAVNLVQRKTITAGE